MKMQQKTNKIWVIGICVLMALGAIYYGKDFAWAMGGSVGFKSEEAEEGATNHETAAREWGYRRLGLFPPRRFITDSIDQF